MVEYICPVHGKRNIKLYNLLIGRQCYECSRISIAERRYNSTLSKRQDSYFEKLQQVCKEKNYELLTKKEEIINNTTYIEYKCPKHGIHKMRLANLLNGRSCPECGYEKARKRYQLPLDQVEKRILECNGVLLNKEEYVNNSYKNLLIKCPECGKPFTTSLVLFTQHGGQVCFDCSNNESIGEKRIRKFLEEHNILFEQEKWFPDCKDIKPLPFDFYLPELQTIIEFDGRQHFEETHLFSFSYEITHKHDLIKNEYCQNNNIRLIRIPYKKINKIEQILSEEINLHKDIV